eukprot:Gb_00319 [translate_table: standard]
MSMAFQFLSSIKTESSVSVMSVAACRSDGFLACNWLDTICTPPADRGAGLFTGFTRLCKGLAAILVIGYAISQEAPVSVKCAGMGLDSTIINPQQLQLLWNDLWLQENCSIMSLVAAVHILVWLQQQQLFPNCNTCSPITAQYLFDSCNATTLFGRNISLGRM